MDILWVAALCWFSFMFGFITAAIFSMGTE